MSEEEISKVNIVLFKGVNCAACKVVEPILRQIIVSSKGSATLTMIDTEEEKELTSKYGITTIPVVYYNDELVLTAEQTSELISGEFDSLQSGSSMMSGGAFELQDVNLGSSQTNAFPSLNFDSPSGDMFNSGQSGLFNHLFNQLITSSVESNAETLERRQKFNMLAISQKTMTPEAFQHITRPALGDYVHIGILQSIVTSILAINPRSSEFLYRVGRDMGRFGNVQFRFLRHYPKIFEHIETSSKFRDILEGLQELYSANSLGLPLYIASRALIQPLSDTKAKLTVYDSAFCAQMSPIGQPVCYLIAGEIAGLIETTLGEQVSVVETRCFGLGDPYCEFSIELYKQRDFSFISERPFLTKSEKEKFQRSLDTITKNMYSSSLIRTILRPGVSDHVHISVLQQTLNGIKFSDPFFSTLLFYAGLHYGMHGADFAIIDRLIKDEADTVLPLSFEDSLNILKGYFNDPATILTRWQGNADLEIKDDETAFINIYESAIASGLNMKGSDFVLDVDIETTLCDFTAGFIQGRLSRICDEKVKVSEVTCLSVGSSFCRFKIELD